jgi:hypothetical protein
VSILIVICAALLIAVLTVVGGLVLASCAVLLPMGLGNLGQCAPPPEVVQPVAFGSDARISQLTAEIAGLERELVGLQCQAVLPEVPAPAFVEPPPPAPDPAPAPLPVFDIEPEEPPAKDLTEEDFDRGDVSVLEGCWELDSVYRTRNLETGRVYVYDKWSICFNETGQGVERMRADSGETCVGPVTGQFTESSLKIIEPANLVCSGSTQIFRRELDCSLDGQRRANCTVRQPEMDTTSTARLRRATGDN